MREIFRKISRFGGAIMVIAIAASVLFGCNSGKNGGNYSSILSTEEIDIETPKATEYSDDYSAYPRAEGETKKEIFYIDLTGCDYNDLYYAIALQGLVNRKDPELYIVHDYIVQAADASFNSPQFWLDALDVSYYEDDGVTPYFVKTKISSVNELLLKYYDSYKGAVLFHDRLTSRNVMCAQNNLDQIYGDMAVLNLTYMMSAQYDALPMTESKLASVNALLVANGKQPLEVLGDTREFMAKNADGTFNTDTGSREVWAACYNYALGKAESGEWTFSDEALGHNGTMNAAWYDYVVQHRIFTYNRILFADATAEEKAVEAKIMTLTKDSTPLMGVFHLAGDEEECVRNCNNYGKYFLVTHETWNLSWSCGLPRVSAKTQEEKLVYDESKVYIAITLSETDNNSYTHFKFPLQYSSESRGKFAMTWALNQACYDINPNVIKYMNATFTSKDGFATGEAGIGYVRNERVREESMANFMGITDFYAGHLGFGSIRTLLNDIYNCMDYLTYCDDIVSILSGYSGVSEAGTNEFNSDNANYYFRDMPIFQNFYGEIDNLLSISADAGSFLSVGLYGWGANIDHIYEVVSSLPENYVTVTQSQLADLYVQKMSKIYNDISTAYFDRPMTEEEMAYLWYSNDFSKNKVAVIEGQEEYRYGSGEDFVIYRFDLDGAAKLCKIDLSVSGEYKVTFSKDMKNWSELSNLGKKDGQYIVSVPESLLGGAIYMKVSVPDANPDGEYRIYGVSLCTDIVQKTPRAVSIGTDADGAYFVSGEEKYSDDGFRQNEVVYRLPFDSATGKLVISAEAEKEATVYVSPDGKNFYLLDTNCLDRSEGGLSSYTYGLLSGIGRELYVKVYCDGEIYNVKATPVKKVSEFLYSPCGSDFFDDTVIYGENLAKKTDGFSSGIYLTNTGSYMMCFEVGEDIGSAMLTVQAGGFFKIEISVDGENFTTLKSIAAGENVDGKIMLDIYAYCKPGNVVYLRYSKSQNVGGNATIYNVQLN